MVAVESIGHLPIRTLSVDVAVWQQPRGWIGSPRLRGVSSVQIERRGAGARVRLTTAKPMDPSLLVAAVLRCLVPVPRDVHPMLTFASGTDAASAKLATRLADVLDASDGNRHLRRCDDLVVGPEGSAEEVVRARTIVPGRVDWTVDGVMREVVVDPTVHRPMGRASTVDGVIGAAIVIDDALVITADRLRLRITGDLTAADVRALEGVRGLISTDPIPVPWRPQLEAIGVVLSQGDLPVDNLAWQVASIHARRHALRWYSPQAALGSWPTVSAVMVTHRHDHVAHVVDHLARLNYPHLQIVIGLHGIAVDQGLFAALRGLHDVVVMPIDRERTLGEALQAACDRADGHLVTKLDDDDHYGSEHIWDLVLARAYSGAQLVGKALDWIHVAAGDILAFRPVYAAESYATFVAGGTMLISTSDLAAVGGWRPVPKSVDRALIDSVKRDGGLVYRTHGLGYVYVRHGAGHTATVDDRHFLTENAQQWRGLLQHEALGTAHG